MFKKKKYDDDDGRVIAPMNVEGMPWFQKGVGLQSANNEKTTPLTRRETLSLLLNAALAGLTVALVLGLVAFLYILFCIHVWLR